MPDGMLNQFLAIGTAAERAAFTPDPPSVLAGPAQGYVWYETDTGKLILFDGAALVEYDPGTGGGALLAANNLSDLVSAGTARTNLGLGTAATSAASAFLAVANNLSDVGNAGTARGNLGLGTAATLASDTDGTFAANSDANLATQKAVKTYVDNLINGRSWKSPVRAATTTAGTLASSFENGDTIDGVTLATGDRILIKDQSTASENGIYVVAASGAPARAVDADSGAEMLNATVVVEEGTANADKLFTCSTNATITLGSTSLTFTQIGTVGGGLLASNNLSDVGSAATARTNLGVAIGSNVQAWDADLDALAALSSTGLIIRTGAGTVAARTLTAPAAGITVSNGDGVSGNPTLGLANDLAALEALSGTNTIYYRSGADTWSAVTVGSGLSFSGGTLSATGFAGSGAITGSGLTMSTARLLGRTTASTGAIEELTAGTGLVLSGGSLTVDTGTSGAKVPLLNGANTWSTTQTFTVAPVFTAASGTRTALGLGTSAVIDTGTSGTKVALTDGVNTWSSAQTDSALATFSAGANLTPAATPATNAVGYLGAPQNIVSGAYTTVMSDAGKHFYHTSGSAHTITIDSNANVAYPIGTILTFVNENGGGNVTLAITSDTLRWGSSTGSRTLAANGTATALKVASTTWRLTGDGIT